MLAQQEKIKQDLVDAKDKKDKIDQQPPPMNQVDRTKRDDDLRELKDDLNKTAETMAGLAKPARDRQKKMAAAEKKRQEEGDKDNADRLKEAAKIGEKAALESKLDKSAKELRKDQAPSNQAIQQQQKNADALDKMLQALEDKKQDSTEEKLTKNKKAKDDVEKLKKKMQELEKQVEDAKNIKDDQERLKKQQELAQEFNKLKDEAEKEARELARLQDKETSKKLDDLAQDFGNIADKLNKGQDPGADEKQADNDLRQAQQALDQAQEELAREQLAKIADRLKGLK